MAKIFKVDKETKIKRKWVFLALVSLTIISFTMMMVGFPFDKEVSLGLYVSFSVALILKIIDWVENSKIIKE